MRTRSTKRRPKRRPKRYEQVFSETIKLSMRTKLTETQLSDYDQDVKKKSNTIKLCFLANPAVGFIWCNVWCHKGIIRYVYRDTFMNVTELITRENVIQEYLYRMSETGLKTIEGILKEKEIQVKEAYELEMIILNIKADTYKK